MLLTARNKHCFGALAIRPRDFHLKAIGPTVDTAVRHSGPQRGGPEGFISFIPHIADTGVNWE